MKVSEFTKKLNYVEGKSYTIEEHISMPEGGVYEDYLEHDNIKEGSLTVYTGPQLTGEPVQTYVLSTPSLTPWKKIIRIYTNLPEVYVCYVTNGDTVEADDINALQDELRRTQFAMKEHEDSISEITEEEIDKLDRIAPEGGGTEGCDCLPLSKEEIAEVIGFTTGEGGDVICGCNPLTREEIKDAIGEKGEYYGKIS